MRLDEIVNLKQVDKIDVPDKKQYVGDESAYAQVFKSDDDHMVKKQTPQHDPYHIFLNWIAQDDRMASNPYLPRVYEQSKDADGNTVLEMEKLFELDTLNSKEIDRISKRVLGMPSANAAKFYVQHTKGLSPNMREEYMKYHHRPVASMIADVTKGGEFADIHDPLMKEALQAIHNMAKDNKDVLIDLHAGNFMIRRGPTGPQLVIIDPLSGTS